MKSLRFFLLFMFLYGFNNLILAVFDGVGSRNLAVEMFGTPQENLSMADKESIYRMYAGHDLDYCSNDAAMLNNIDTRAGCIMYSVIADADIHRTNYRNANLKGKNLSGYNFKFAILWGADLTDAKVRGTSFYRAKGLTNEQKQYLRENGAINVPLDIVYELEDYDKEVFDPSTLSRKEKIKRYFVKKYNWYFGTRNQGTQKFEEDLEDYDKEVFDPSTLSRKEKIKRYFVKKYKWYFGTKNQGTQRFEEDLEEFLKDVYYPETDLNFIHKIKNYFLKKYKMRFKMQSEETQTEEIAIQTDLVESE